jgi:hypothetical protein
LSLKWEPMKGSSSGEPLEYRSRRAFAPEPDLDLLACSFAFAVGHWVTEAFTSYLVLFRLRLVATSHLVWQFAGDMLTETIWMVPAFFFVLVMQFMLRPREGSDRRVGLWPVAIGMGVFYSWVRWGVWWFAKLDYWSDFSVAMGLALAVGVVLGALRRRWV